MFLACFILKKFCQKEEELFGKGRNLQKIKSKAYLVKNIADYNKDGFFQGFGFTDDGESSAGECFAIP